MSTLLEKTQTGTQKTTFVVNRRLQLKWKGVWCEKDGTFEASGDELQRPDVTSWIAHEWVHELRDGERIVPAGAVKKPAAAPVATTQAASGEAHPGNQVQMVALDKIKPDPTQPRKTFTPEAMTELVDSIRDKGVVQAIQLRPMSRWRQIVSFVARQWVRMERGDKHEDWHLDVVNFWKSGIEISNGETMTGGAIMQRLADEGRIRRDVATHKGWEPMAGALEPLVGDRTLLGEAEWLEIVYGERRWRGSQEAGVAAIPAKVNELTDIEAAELQAIENLKRKDLLPLEDAAQCRKLLDTPGYGMDRLVKTTGWKRNTIYGKLKMLDLPGDAKEWLQRGDLPASTAEALGRRTGRVQQRAIKAILHADRHQIEEGKKVPSHAVCLRIIERIEKEEEILVRWEEAQTAAREKGITPLPEKEAEAEMTYNTSGEPRYDSKYISTSQRCHQHSENLTWGKILGKSVGSIPKHLGRDRDGNGHVWILRSTAEAEAKRLGVKLAASGGGGSRGAEARQKAQEAAERKRRAAQREKENAGLAEIVAKVQQLGPDRLSSKFWREMASTVAEDCWSDTSRRVSGRRGAGIKGRANEKLSKQTETMDGNTALGLLAELIIVGMRGGSSWGEGLSKKIARMRGILGLVKPGESLAENESADVRTGTDEQALEHAA